jgi:23S rRNA (cytosine1962-C5)-methyltransferase
MHDRFAAALARRQGLLDNTSNAVRLVDGEGDQLPGIFLESYAGRWLVATHGDDLPPPARAWLTESGRSVYWKRLDQHQKQDPVHLCGPAQSGPFVIHEHHTAFEVSFQSGYSQGIFLDQRDNRRIVSELAATSVLNTFAYTGGFSVCAARAGAQTTTLDLSQVYLDWARRNFALNQIDPLSQHFCKGDTFHWLRRFAKQQRRFEGIILDPPTFSRDADGKVFRVEKDYPQLVALALACLAPNGWILCSTNCRKLPAYEFEMMLREGAARPVELSDSPMPADFTGEQYLKSIWLRT